MPMGPSPVALDALPSMPAAAVRIVGLCDDPDVDLSGLAEAVALDPVLSARILRIANSAAYRRGDGVTSIDRAMMLMGVKLVRLTALQLVVSSTLTEQLDDDDEVSRQMWRKCLVTAVACRELAQLARLRATPEAFLAGLFDGMGQLLGLVTRGETYGPLLAEVAFPGAEAERACLGMTSSELVQAALRSWGVPELYARVLEVADAEDPEFDDSEVGRLSAVVVLARQATRLLLGHPSEDDAIGHAATALGLEGHAVDSIAVDLGEHVTSLAGALGVDLGAEVDFPALLSRARNQMAGIEDEIGLQGSGADLGGGGTSTGGAANLDPLTGIPDRAGFDGRFARAVESRIVHRTVTGALGVALLDIDRFDDLVRCHGRDAGDRVLAELGRMLDIYTRKGETITRFDDSTFALLMPIVETAEELANAAERFRGEIAALRIDHEGGVLQVTASVAAVASSAIDRHNGGPALLAEAERLLQRARSDGGNRSCSEYCGRLSMPVAVAVHPITSQ